MNTRIFFNLNFIRRLDYNYFVHRFNATVWLLQLDRRFLYIEKIKNLKCRCQHLNNPFIMERIHNNTWVFFFCKYFSHFIIKCPDYVSIFSFSKTLSKHRTNFMVHLWCQSMWCNSTEFCQSKAHWTVPCSIVATLIWLHRQPCF